MNVMSWTHRVLSNVPSLSQLMWVGCRRPLAAHSSTTRLPSVVVTSPGLMMNSSADPHTAANFSLLILNSDKCGITVVTAVIRRDSGNFHSSVVCCFNKFIRSSCSKEHRQLRILRRRKASRCCQRLMWIPAMRSTLSILEITTALNICWSASSNIPWGRRIFSAYRCWAHELVTLNMSWNRRVIGECDSKNL